MASLSLDSTSKKRNKFHLHAFPAKISHYSLKFQYQGLETINRDHNLKRNKNRSLPTRNKDFYYPEKSVQLTNRRQNRQKQSFSTFLSNQIEKLHENEVKDDDKDLKNKSKIKELKQIMKQKHKFMSQNHIDHLLETKDRESEAKKYGKTVSMHSKEHQFSPNMRNYKNEFHHKKQEPIAKFYAINYSKQQQTNYNKKILLKGDGINFQRNIATTDRFKSNEVSIAKKKPLTVQSYHRTRYIHSRKYPFLSNHDNKISVELYENDCKPWDVGRHHHLEEQFIGLKVNK